MHLFLHNCYVLNLSVNILYLVTFTLKLAKHELATKMLRKSHIFYSLSHIKTQSMVGGGPRVVVSTAAFHARVRGSVPGLGGFKETKLFLPHPCVKVSIVGSLRDREVACSASDRQGSNFESCVWRTVSSQSSHHPQEVLLAQFSLYVHKGGLKPDSFHFITIYGFCKTFNLYCFLVSLGRNYLYMTFKSKTSATSE